MINLKTQSSDASGTNSIRQKPIFHNTLRITNYTLFLIRLLFANGVDSVYRLL